MGRQQEEWQQEEMFESKAHFLCSRNGYEKPVASKYTSPEAFLRDEIVYTERFKYYYAQLRAGKMQVL